MVNICIVIRLHPYLAFPVYALPSRRNVVIPCALRAFERVDRKVRTFHFSLLRHLSSLGGCFVITGGNRDKVILETDKLYTANAVPTARHFCAPGMERFLNGFGWQSAQGPFTAADFQVYRAPATLMVSVSALYFSKIPISKLVYTKRELSKALRSDIYSPPTPGAVVLTCR
ncbi:hypothetical protein EJ06DRAFT_308737 [Trichodelitschia bisporula]|uniref:Uncharacterized protein n=1 Tax=Trichodelitschia bisporula TaxID=703511 RepID=A0A6G1I392_9PEZI|nr:hypothetical protein EJ06DRAFT_308737 [Trichodelitschia bisporula]